MADQQHYSTIVIGAGSGGLTVAIGLAQLGKHVALVESKAVGGDCTNVGCIPSKTLIHEADQFDRGETDVQTVLATVQVKRNNLRDRETHEVQNLPQLEFVRGRAQFVAAKRLRVHADDGTQRELSADQIVIATGSRPRIAEIAGLPAERTLTNESVFELHTAPRHLAIVGSGPLALELAFAFRKLGSAVSIVTRDDRVFGNGVAEASDVLHAALIERGVDLCYNATATRYDAATRTLHISTPAGERHLEAVDYVLMGLGRERNIDRLGLEQAGVRYDPHNGIAVDSWGRTNVAGMYAVGDVTPTSRWTHSAGAQGRRVVQRIAFPWLPARGDEPLYPNATFTDPEVANVGLMPDQIAKRFHPRLITTLRVELPTTDKGYTDNLQRGFIQVHALRLSGRVLGATIVAPHAGEMISFWTLAISQNISLFKLYRLVYPYPTLSSGIQKIADAFMRQTLPHLPREAGAVARYGLATLWGRVRNQPFDRDAARTSRAVVFHAADQVRAS